MASRTGGKRASARGGRAAFLRLAIGLVLGMGACNREFGSPYVPGGEGYAGDEWTADADGDGVADSVAKYLPDCPHGPRQCLENAKVLSRIGLDFSLSAADMILWKGARGVSPRLTWEPAEASVRGSALQSSDTAKVRIRQGLMDAVGTGNAQVSVTVPGESRIASYIVKVVDSGRAVEAVAAKDMTLEAGAEGVPDLAWTPSDATHREYSLSIDDPAVAWASGSRIQGLSPGKTSVTVEALDGGHRTAFTLTVAEGAPKVEAVSILVEDMYLVIGEEAAPPVVHWLPADVTDKRYLLVPEDTAVAGANKSRDRLIPKSEGATLVQLFALDGSGKAVSFTVHVSGRAVPVAGLAAADLKLAAGGTPVQPALVWTPQDATNRRYTLASESPDVASAFGGMVHPVSAGRALFTAVSDDGGHPAHFYVDVALPDTAIHVDSAKAQDMTLTVGQEKKPVLAWYPADAGNQAYTLASSDDRVAYAVGEWVHGAAPGTALFTLTTADKGRTATFTVTVGAKVVPVQSVTGAPLSLLIGDVTAPSLVWHPADATRRDYVLTSGNPAIARIVGDTLVEGVAVGLTEVFIQSADGPLETIQVTVNARQVPVIALSVPAQTMNAGDQLDLAGLIQWVPANATDKGYRIVSSSDKTVVSIVDNRLHALASGSADVVVESHDAGARDTFAVAVRKPLKSFSVRDTSLYPGAGDVDPVRLTTWVPADADNKGYSLRILDTAVASAVGNKVRPLQSGLARVVMTSLENPALIDTFRVTVLAPVKNLSVRDTTVAPGERSINLGPALTWTPADAHDKSWRVEWAGLWNPGVLTLYPDGTFDAVWPGTARLVVISVQNSAARDTLTVTVAFPVAVFAVGCTDFPMKEGDPDRAPPIKWTPPDATNKNYTLLSSNPENAAIVDGTMVRALKHGPSTLTVISADGNHMGQCKVDVRR